MLEANNILPLKKTKKTHLDLSFEQVHMASATCHMDDSCSETFLSFLEWQCCSIPNFGHTNSECSLLESLSWTGKSDLND